MLTRGIAKEDSGIPFRFDKVVLNDRVVVDEIDLERLIRQLRHR